MRKWIKAFLIAVLILAVIGSMVAGYIWLVDKFGITVVIVTGGLFVLWLTTSLVHENLE